jgi:ATP synthase protein I
MDYLKEREKLHEQVKSDIRRKTNALKNRHQVLAQTIFLGTLGLVMILPIIGGAYLGRWLDQKFVDNTVNWTVSLLIIGVLIGAINAYLLIRET